MIGERLCFSRIALLMLARFTISFRHYLREPVLVSGNRDRTEHYRPTSVSSHEWRWRRAPESRKG